MRQSCEKKKQFSSFFKIAFTVGDFRQKVILEYIES